MYEVVGPWLLWLRAFVPDAPLVDIRDQYFATLAECQQAGVQWVTSAAKNEPVQWAESLCSGQYAKDTTITTTNPARPYLAKQGEKVTLVVATYCQPRCGGTYDAVGVTLLKRYRDVSE